MSPSPLLGCLESLCVGVLLFIYFSPDGSGPREQSAGRFNIYIRGQSAGRLTFIYMYSFRFFLLLNVFLACETFFEKQLSSGTRRLL
jgi:hypothetical protein